MICFQIVFITIFYITSNIASAFLLPFSRQSNVKYQHAFNKKIDQVNKRSTSLNSLITSPFDDIIPFVSEHIQPSDQLLVLTATSNDFPIKLANAGYGSLLTGFMTVVSPDKNYVDECNRIILTDPVLKERQQKGKLRFVQADLSKMPEICKQSVFDAIVDYEGIDSLISSDASNTLALNCIDSLQNAVRLGNILVCLSKLEKDVFCAPFDQRFGWVQELDGDPGELSAWYRDGKSNLKATKSNFGKLGLKMFVYTNTDNC
eukprot:gene11652-15604_t